MFVYNICLFTSHLKKTQTKKSQEQGIIPTTKNIPKKERITQTTELKKKISIEKWKVVTVSCGYPSTGRLFTLTTL